MTPQPDSALVDRVVPAANFEPRKIAAPPSILLLHYTGMASAARAVHWLTVPESRVSCHYLVDEHGHVVQMVAERERAWHAGVAFWRGERDVNSASIGIEIHNPGHDLGYPDFPGAQIDAVRELCLDIMARTGIQAAGVLAHSDVAPRRKSDPGEKFPWARLAAAGIGLWHGLADDLCGDEGEAGCAGTLADAQRRLAGLGYEIDATGENDPQTVAVLTAFQRHFRPARVTGRLDRGTMRVLEALGAG